MKTNNLHRILAATGLLLFSLGSASAQFSVNGGATRYNATKEYNPLRMTFAQAWTMPLSDPVKLIDVAPVLNDRDANVLLLVDGTQKGDYRRKLVVTHWDGLQWVNDTSINFFGTVMDCLLTGRFRPVPKAPVAVTPVSTDKKAKKVPTPPTRQIVTTEGIYQWTGGTLRRLCSAPPNLKLALMLDGKPDQMLINAGDQTATYEITSTEGHPDNTDIQPSEFELVGDEPGYPHFGIGTELYEGIKEFLPGVRYVQTYFNGHYRWYIGVLRGKSAELRDLPDATTGDRLVVYVPKAENRDKPFWQLTRPDQYEEAWRGPAVPGRILDVRVGDAKREGKSGILVLTSEKEERERHLTYFLPVEAVRRPGP